MCINNKFTEFNERYRSLTDEVRLRESLKKSLETRLASINTELNEKRNQLEVLTQATTLLTTLKDEKTVKTYKFIEDNINNALSQIFTETPRQIRLVETVHSDTHHHLNFELIVGNNIVELNNSGHGISQIISLISTLCLIVLKGERRLLCLDEVLSGIDYKGRLVVDTILNSFAELGFQFIIVEHDYVPSNAIVYELGLSGGECVINNQYITDKCYSGYKSTD